METISYRELRADEVCRELFADFIRRQEVNGCWRCEEGVWVVRSAPFIDDWSEEDYQELIAGLRRTASCGGFVYGAFREASLKGFASVEPEMFGGEEKYLDLAHIYVSQELRGRGIGKSLFQAAKAWARSRGAEKLYISAHSAVESQAFYRAMGCTEASRYDAGHVEAEPCDCQLECTLSEERK